MFRVSHASSSKFRRAGFGQGLEDLFWWAGGNKTQPGPVSRGLRLFPGIDDRLGTITADR